MFIWNGSGQEAGRPQAQVDLTFKKKQAQVDGCMVQGGQAVAIAS